MDVSDARWRKSSRSASDGSSCVEVADNLVGVVFVRDTKDRDGGTLEFAPAVWQAFVNRAARRS